MYLVNKKKANNLLHTTRNVVQWWTKETYVSLNKRKVTRKDWGLTYMMKKQLTS
jgi:hypothetical protein